MSLVHLLEPFCGGETSLHPTLNTRELKGFGSKTELNTTLEQLLLAASTTATLLNLNTPPRVTQLSS